MIYIYIYIIWQFLVCFAVIIFLSATLPHKIPKHIQKSSKMGPGGVGDNFFENLFFAREVCRRRLKTSMF